MIDTIYSDPNFLQHHGVKGMKWGVRRYQNADGSLTDKGKKLVAEEYRKRTIEGAKDLNKNWEKMNVRAYNKAAQYMNNGGIEKFNKQQEKKYGKDFAKRDGYVDDYLEKFDALVSKNLDRSLYRFYTTNKHWQEAQALVDEYNMVEWDDAAQKNAEALAYYIEPQKNNTEVLK